MAGCCYVCVETGTVGLKESWGKVWYLLFCWFSVPVFFCCHIFSLIPKLKLVAHGRNFFSLCAPSQTFTSILSLIPIMNDVKLVNLRVQTLNVRCESKTKDNVFVQIEVSVQYKVTVSFSLSWKPFFLLCLRLSMPKLLIINLMIQKHKVRFLCPFFSFSETIFYLS